MADNKPVTTKHGFQPGQSGNPGGRPKKLEELRVRIVEMKDTHLNRLEAIAQQGENRDAIAAIKLMWAYAYGSPATVITGEDGEPLRLDVNGLLGSIKKLASE